MSQCRRQQTCRAICNHNQHLLKPHEYHRRSIHTPTPTSNPLRQHRLLATEPFELRAPQGPQEQGDPAIPTLDEAPGDQLSVSEDGTPNMYFPPPHPPITNTTPPHPPTTNTTPPTQDTTTPSTPLQHPPHIQRFLTS